MDVKQQTIRKNGFTVTVGIILASTYVIETNAFSNMSMTTPELDLLYRSALVMNKHKSVELMKNRYSLV